MNITHLKLILGLIFLVILSSCEKATDSATSTGGTGSEDSEILVTAKSASPSWIDSFYASKVSSRFIELLGQKTVDASGLQGRVDLPSNIELIDIQNAKLFKQLHPSEVELTVSNGQPRLAYTEQDSAGKAVFKPESGFAASFSSELPFAVGTSSYKGYIAAYIDEEIVLANNTASSAEKLLEGEESHFTIRGLASMKQLKISFAYTQVAAGKLYVYYGGYLIDLSPCPDQIISETPACLALLGQDTVSITIKEQESGKSVSVNVISGDKDSTIEGYNVDRISLNLSPLVDFKIVAEGGHYEIRNIAIARY
jgi:hypothetical protein